MYRKSQKTAELDNNNDAEAKFKNVDHSSLAKKNLGAVKKCVETVHIHIGNGREWSRNFKELCKKLSKYG